ncbi:septal ring lytic transglycosylase RlpA family protein [Shewanella ulleungensis]|jgi:rare lipoprotein A|uniref:Endolytic peptidoglycan transglycosylase RlpA n=1 Tax=Shewanella ulleungensis TaxID=2282699 RepID=A0ABQ2QX66_9GAMM|nr:septal ring lytic transglycosylase RlpA family protein [Shewanella ulleungensis]MCL1152016.1 septal ring lytic transglycosylase RlpA family protein [Shewanella ulleungensis]GGP98765.1 RplA family protein [Shewanella ulleungensis]
MVAISRIFLLFSFSLILVGCSTIQPDSRDRIGFTEFGQASYYSDIHQNNQTANGDVYQHNFKTAAHKTLPFGANVKVTNIANGKSVIVNINDRGPFVKGRIIDLSKSAFSSISNISAGVIEVKIEVVR